MSTTTAPAVTSTLKFTKVEDWYPGLSRYEARVEHPVWPGTYIVEAVPSSVYEGRIDGWTVKYVPDGFFDNQGRQVGSIKTRFGQGERKFAAAKDAARTDHAAWHLVEATEAPRPVTAEQLATAVWKALPEGEGRGSSVAPDGVQSITHRNGWILRIFDDSDESAPNGISWWLDGPEEPAVYSGGYQALPVTKLADAVKRLIWTVQDAG